MATYPYTIASLYSKNPGLPETLGNINLNQTAEEGLYAGLTEEVAESAEQRALVLEIVHAQSEYPPATMTDIRQQLDTLPAIVQELRDLNADVKVGRAETANALIRVRNLLICPGQLSAVQKTVPGSGLLFARAQAPDQATQNAISLFANTNSALANADIGSSPPSFDAVIDNYEHIDCLKLIFFYNEDMGIVAGSGLPERKQAVRKWLTKF